MSRDDLLKTNSDIVGQVTEQVAKIFAGRFHYRRFKSAGCDDAGCFPPFGIS